MPIEYEDCSTGSPDANKARAALAADIVSRAQKEGFSGSDIVFACLAVTRMLQQLAGVSDVSIVKIYLSMPKMRPEDHEKLMNYEKKETT